MNLSSRATNSSAQVKLSLAEGERQVKIDVLKSVLAEKGQEWTVKLAHTRQNIVLRSASEVRLKVTVPSTRYPYGSRRAEELNEAGDALLWKAPRVVHSNWQFSFELVVDVVNDDPYSSNKTRPDVLVSDESVAVYCAL